MSSTSVCEQLHLNRNDNILFSICKIGGNLQCTLLAQNTLTDILTSKISKN